MREAGIRVSLFIAAEPRQIQAAVAIGAPVIEIHTGAWCDALADKRTVGGGSRMAAHPPRARSSRGVSGSKFMPATASISHTAEAIAALPEIVELNIGHFLIGEAVFSGLAECGEDHARAAHGLGAGA